jgi:hypothetical protein
MPYFLDGNNLIGRARRTARPSEEDQAALISEVSDRLRRTKARALLFFDGAGARNSSMGNLTIRPCPGGNADDAIVREIERTRAPQEIVVVTDDRELSRRSRDLGAKSLSCAEFWRRVGSSGVAAEEDREQPVDVEQWTRYFEKGKKE